MRKPETASTSPEINGKKPRGPGKPKEKRHLSRGSFTTSVVTPLPDPAEVFKDYTPTEETSVEDRLDDENVIHSLGESLPNQGFAGSGRTLGEVRGIPEPVIPEDPKKLAKDNISLRKALKKAHEKLEKKVGKIDESWFETAHYINEDEREIMNLFFRDMLDIDTIADKINKPSLLVERMIQSATRKRSIREGQLEKGSLPIDNQTPKD